MTMLGLASPLVHLTINNLFIRFLPEVSGNEQMFEYILYLHRK